MVDVHLLMYCIHVLCTLDGHLGGLWTFRVVNDDWALRQAKQNIEHFYEVVGLVEMLAETIAVLEKRLPKFFSGASEILTQIGEVQTRKHQTIRSLKLFTIFHSLNYHSFALLKCRFFRSAQCQSRKAKCYVGGSKRTETESDKRYHLVRLYQRSLVETSRGALSVRRALPASTN